MYKKLSFKTSIILFTALIVSFICFSACSNNAPVLNNAKLSIVFDYDDYESLPKARLSIFVEASSNPRRFESITVTSNKNELVWESKDLILAETNEISYCGLTNLVMPEKEIIPAGEYKITFTQSDDEAKEVVRTLNYDKQLYDTKGSDVAALMGKTSATKMITIYDNEKKVLYYGPRKRELSDSRRIWNEYRTAAEFQESWVNSNGTVICNMPVEKVEPGN